MTVNWTGDRPQLPAGHVLARRFVVRQRLGRGTIGDVYAGFDRLETREIAVKVIDAELLNAREAANRFRAELRAANALPSACVVPVQLHETPEAAFLTADLLEGRSLRAELAIRRGLNKPLSITEVVDFADRIGRLLGEAHRRRVVHRNLKPENIWIGKRESLGLTDFAVAHLWPTADSPTPHRAFASKCVAPEQRRADAAVDQRADQFALAAVVYELLTGQLPAEVAQPASELRPDAPPSLCEAVMRGLSYEPDLRFDDVGEFVSAVAAARPRRSLWPWSRT